MSNNLTITVENYWNERLEKVEIFYHNSDLPNNNAFVFFDLENRQSSTTVDSGVFPLSTRGESSWKARIRTESGTVWSSGDFLLCQINPDDNNTVTISFDGNFENMTVYYPSSSSCSKKMELSKKN